MDITGYAGRLFASLNVNLDMGSGEHPRVAQKSNGSSICQKKNGGKQIDCWKERDGQGRVGLLNKWQRLCSAQTTSWRLYRDRFNVLVQREILFQQFWGFQMLLRYKIGFRPSLLNSLNEMRNKTKQKNSFLMNTISSPWEPSKIAQQRRIIAGSEMAPDKTATRLKRESDMACTIENGSALNRL